MASTYVKLASVTVGAGGASSIDFTSIPSTYTDLVVKVSYRTTDATNTGTLISTFNNDTAGNYNNRFLFGTGSGTGSGNYTSNGSNYHGYGNISTTTSNTFANAEIYIPNYAGSTNKSSSSDNVSENNATAANATLGANIWNNSSAINQVTLGVYAQNFAQYSTATLYGVKKYAETGTGSKAIGGTITTAGGYTYHTFFSSGMFTPTTNITGADVLVVGGGGGSAGGVSGGAGAGGLVYATSQSYTSGVNYAAIVGSGGAASSNGTNSAFAAGTVALGGGANQANGGSGGGQNAPGAGSTGTGTAGQGNNGGARGSNYSGGGGGAGAAGGTGGANSRGGDGGAGLSTYSAFGAATATGENLNGTYWYAGGGGGSAWNGVTPNNLGGIAGSGGGGKGGEGGASSAPATNGLPFTGGGAGGDNTSGKSGGSGIVIVRYTT